MSNRSYGGIGFEIRNAGRAWYWLVDSANRGGGSIGAAATEAAAVDEARAAIEEISALHDVSRREGSWIDQTPMPDWIDS
ncbi:MAG: hypothetical protein ACYDC3_20705, partial [Candidatus Binataceae bacterium]